MVRQNVSGIILQLVSVFLLFDGNPQNLTDPTFRDYGCRASMIVRPGASGAFPVVCTVSYDARAGRQSEYYVEVPHPRPGQIMMGCAFGFDQSQNRSDCVAPDFAQASHRGVGDVNRDPDEGEGEVATVEVDRDRADSEPRDTDGPEARRSGGKQRVPKRR